MAAQSSATMTDLDKRIQGLPQELQDEILDDVFESQDNPVQRDAILHVASYKPPIELHLSRKHREQAARILFGTNVIQAIDIKSLYYFLKSLPPQHVHLIKDCRLARVDYREMMHEDGGMTDLDLEAGKTCTTTRNLIAFELGTDIFAPDSFSCEFYSNQLHKSRMVLTGPGNVRYPVLHQELLQEFSPGWDREVRRFKDQMPKEWWVSEEEVSVSVW